MNHVIAVFRPLTRRKSSLAARIALWFTVRRERRRLAGLNAHELRDLGISRDAARREAERLFWDAPGRWRR